MGDTIEKDIFKEPRSEETEKKGKKRRMKLLLVSVLLVGLVTGAYALSQLFTQDFPQTTATQSSITPGCTTLAAGVPVGSYYDFQCSTTTAAFTVNTAGSYTPSFTLNSTGPFDRLYIAQSSVCNATPLTALNSTQPVNLAIGQYSYCAHVAIYGKTQSAFSIVWSQ